jgi:uncharacterized phiE125 gp8 family phage protein
MLIKTSIAAQRAITLAKAKEHLRVDQDIEDELIAGYLDAAIDSASIWLNRALNQCDYQQSFSEWPACSYLDLAIAPIVSVEGLVYFDEEGEEQTVDPALWSFVTTPSGGRMYLLEDFTFPTLRELPTDQIYVSLTAGYDADDGSSGTDPELTLPPAITSAILLTVGHLYANRESVIVGKGAAVLPQAAEFLLDRYKIYR